jgi:hypothetical protein
VEGQLKKDVDGNAPRFKAVLRGLSELESYCANWAGGGFDIHAFQNASGESSATLNMYEAERTFMCPDGNYRVFSWHLKRADFTRIHFFDQPQTRRIIVGYVGKHLPTATQ